MISVDEGAEFAKKHEILFLETSAKTGHNIEQVYYIITRNKVVHSSCGPCFKQD